MLRAVSEGLVDSANLPIASMHPPPAILERALASITRGADSLLLAALRRLFTSNEVPTSPEALEALAERLAPYTDPELLADPDRLFPIPERLEITRALRRPLYKLGRRVEAGIDERLTYATPYRPFAASYEQQYVEYPELSTGHVWAWRHLEPARATVLLAHGWGVGHWRIHQREYDVPFLFHELGLDVYFYLAPFHGRRTPSQARFGGQLHPSSDLVRSNEAFIQTITELRGVVSMIQDRNPAPIGMMGSSLGGYTSALMASVDDRLDFVVPILPPASFAHLLWDHGEHVSLRGQAEALGMSRDRFHEFWALHSPLSYEPKVPWGRRMIVTGLGDTLVTADHTRDLWEHWQRPRHFRFPGGHAWQLGRSRYHREIGQFLRDIRVI